MLLPESIQNLVTALERLPGIGPKSASRLAFYLLRAPEEKRKTWDDMKMLLADMGVELPS